MAIQTEIHFSKDWKIPFLVTVFDTSKVERWEEDGKHNDQWGYSHLHIADQPKSDYCISSRMFKSTKSARRHQKRLYRRAVRRYKREQRRRGSFSEGEIAEFTEATS